MPVPVLLDVKVCLCWCCVAYLAAAESAGSGDVDGDGVASVPIGDLTLEVVSDQIQALLLDVGGRAMEGKERKKSTLKNVLSQRRSGVSDFG
jgi:hypothetical protein